MRPFNILITAGPTREYLDPVRFISNRSSGVMGFSIARLAARRGHKVVLISGPVHLAVPEGVDFFSVESARQMYERVLKEFSRADVIIMAAAVADYRPARSGAHKIKKSKRPLNLKLARNPDILEALGRRKKGKLLVGFALETENLYKNALKKLKKKNLDLIVANRFSKNIDIFGEGATRILILDKNGNKSYFYGTKAAAAREILLTAEKMALRITGGLAKW